MGQEKGRPFAPLDPDAGQPLRLGNDRTPARPKKCIGREATIPRATAHRRIGAGVPALPIAERQRPRPSVSRKGLHFTICGTK